MKIKRNVSGAEMEFELTQNEMYEAYYDQQHRFDVEDIKWWFLDISDEELAEDYGKTRAEIEAMYDDIACEMRRNIEKYDMEWTYARDMAIADIV